jgi:hypothetical protein
MIHAAHEYTLSAEMLSFPIPLYLFSEGITWTFWGTHHPKMRRSVFCAASQWIDVGEMYGISCEEEIKKG